MNNHQLEKLGVPRSAFKFAIQGIQKLAKCDNAQMKNVKALISSVMTNPDEYKDNVYFSDLAKSIIEDRDYKPHTPIGFKIWGKDLIDPNAMQQMTNICAIPVARKAAMMPDSHFCHSIPVGGVVGLENAISVEMVGPDIACRIKFSFLDIKPVDFFKKHNLFCDALNKGTSFGTGGERIHRTEHPVFDKDWNITKVTRESKDKAYRQLGTSGSSNHFVNFGVVELFEKDEVLGLDAGEYVGIMSHSGSRGTGADIYRHYGNLAKTMLPDRYKEQGLTPWLDLNTQAGQEYFEAMTLAGDYAAANHDVIHKNLSKLSGTKIIAGVENHHNFAFKEIHDGKELIVHRKGATPASLGEYGAIPSSMGTPAYIVKGLGNPDSLNSASHGTGRVLSRTQAKNKYNFKAVKNDLAKKGITVLGAGADEVPGAYKDINEVLAAQADLVQPIAKFMPVIVRMSDDPSRGEN